MSGSPDRLLLAPRLSGRAETDWYPWLFRQLSPSDGEGLNVLAAPDPDRPDIGLWPRRIAAAIGADIRVASRTVLVGHSVGCLAVLHALACLPLGVQVRGVVAVAGFFHLDRFDPALGPWLAAPLDLDAVKGAARRIVALISTDDPYIPDAAASRRTWEERLGAKAVIVPGAGHFTGAWAPAVLDAVRGLRA